MQVIRWMMLVGFLVFAAGLLFLSYFDNQRIGLALGIVGFALVLLGVVGGNWMASHSVPNQRYGRAHRISVVGFCIAVVGIVVGEWLSDVGTFVMVAGLCTMFLGFFLVVLCHA